MNWQERAEKAEKLLKSITADIDGMESDRTIEVEGEEEVLLGGFSAGLMDYGPGGDDWYISWPCILIMRDKIREHLEEVAARDELEQVRARLHKTYQDEHGEGWEQALLADKHRGDVLPRKIEEIRQELRKEAANG